MSMEQEGLSDPTWSCSTRHHPNISHIKSCSCATWGEVLSEETKRLVGLGLGTPVNQVTLVPVQKIL